MEDLCISRPKSRFTWGIEITFDAGYVTYVWFDALLNYVSGLEHIKGDEAPAYWKVCNHFIAKDILKPHGVFWPTMLMAAGYPLYANLNVHGYWNMGESKMSKSLGNVIRPLEMKDRFGLDSFRYFLLREMVFGMDSGFTEDAFVARFNADLSNGLGNLNSRVLSMVHRYFDGKIPATSGNETDADKAVRDAFSEAEAAVKTHVESLAFHSALEAIWAAIAVCDKYIVETAPFKLWKQDGMQDRVGVILHTLCDALRHVARLISPFMPDTAARIAELLNADPKPFAETAPAWFTSYVDGHSVQPAEPLFPRIDVDGK